MKTCPQCQNEFPADVEFCPNDGMKLRRSSTDEDPLLDRVLDRRWVVEEKIGEGGMGSVYRGHQKSVNRPIAIKTLRKSLVDSDEFVDRFFREAQIASKINHPNCVTIYDYGHTEDDVLFIVMEFLDGKPLSDLADEGSLSLEAILEIACDTTRALAAAHAFNVVHRDLKPDNIFVVDVPGGGKNAKVLDFGIAKALDAEKSMTRTGMIFGTPEYMSPEQCAGTEIDPRSDLYSLGCILYELVGGRTPFRATTPMAVLMAHVNEAAPDLEGAEIIPKSLETVIFKLLEKNPDARFDSANSLLEVLEGELQALRNGGAGATIPGAKKKDTSAMAFGSTVAMPESGPQVAATPRNPTDIPAAPGRSTAKLGAIAVAVLVLVGVAGIAALNLATPGDEASATPTDEPTIEAAEGSAENQPLEKPDPIEPPEPLEPLESPEPLEPAEPLEPVEPAEIAAPGTDTDNPEPTSEPSPDPSEAEVAAKKAEPKTKKEPRKKSPKKEAKKPEKEPAKVVSKRESEAATKSESDKTPQKTTDKQFEEEMDGLLGP